MSIEKMVSELVGLFGKVDRIGADHADKLLGLLDRAPKDALVLLVQRRVKFCTMPAARRLVRDHGMTEEQVRGL